eukprot:TRINITY_DN8515_c0_g1_i5.p1 TRINITY_DN8515_c0_g1~~TRINITY_DN8515_c0_g1_i5.p1  ORF type:complete len:158 (-),score=22.60 TRINITY_DN8515_c0_g1_i5:220-693(-)
MELTINKKQLEIDTKQKDVVAWKKVVENLGKENNSLREIIAELKQKNQKLNTTLLTHGIKQSALSHKEIASPPIISRLNYDNPNANINQMEMGSKDEESAAKSTERLINVLRTSSPIRRKVAEEHLSPDFSAPLPEPYSNHNRTGSLVTAVSFGCCL